MNEKFRPESSSDGTENVTVELSRLASEIGMLSGLGKEEDEKFGDSFGECADRLISILRTTDAADHKELLTQFFKQIGRQTLSYRNHAINTKLRGSITE